MTAAGATLSSANPPPLQIRTIKEDHSGRLEEYQSPTAVYVPGRRVWEVDAPIDAAFPCATQAGILLPCPAVHAVLAGMRGVGSLLLPLTRPALRHPLAVCSTSWIWRMRSCWCSTAAGLCLKVSRAAAAAVWSGRAVWLCNDDSQDFWPA